MSLSRCSLTSEQVRKYYMSGGPEAHESTGIIFVETQVRGGKVLLGKGVGVGTCRGLVTHVCLEGLGHIGLPNLSRTFFWSHKSSLGMPTAQGRGPGICLAPFPCLPMDHLVQRALRLRNFGHISRRDLRAGCLVLSPHRACVGCRRLKCGPSCARRPKVPSSSIIGSREAPPE